MEHSKMENILKDVNAVVGVMGSLVCDDNGQVLARSLPDVFDEASLSPVGRTMAQTLAGLRLARRRKVNGMDLVYGEGRLVVKNLRGGHLCILCMPTINVPLLNLTANVAAKKLATMLTERREIVMGEAAVRKATTAHTLALHGEIRSIISAAREQGVVLRATGDTAMRLRCPSADRITPSSNDNILDLAGRASQSGRIGDVLEGLGYLPELRFNVLRGRQRLRYTHPEKQLGVEVFLDMLHMYHQLDFTNRLHLDEDTIPLADLLLWKLQHVEPDEDELGAIHTIVYDHELGGPGESEKIDMTRILDLCTSNWGWYKTVTTNLEKSIAAAEDYLGDAAAVFVERAGRLLQMIEEAPKTGGWQLRARIGESMRWYEMPE
jgi:predicted regulator of Ras-like GTPase activity (Roadblock/LC7/MglB family)